MSFLLEELPKLSPEEIELIFSKAADLRLRQIGLSEEDLAVIDEADQNFERDGGIPLAQIQQEMKSWPISHPEPSGSPRFDSYPRLHCQTRA